MARASPVGSTTCEWPPISVRECVPAVLQAMTTHWFSMARAWASSVQWVIRRRGQAAGMTNTLAPASSWAR